MLNIMKILTKKILNLKLVITSEYQNTKRFLLKDTRKSGQKKFLLLAKLINTVPWTYQYLNGELITGSFFEKELQKSSQEKFRVEKVIKRKGEKLYVKWKGYGNSFNSWSNKKDCL